MRTEHRVVDVAAGAGHHEGEGDCEAEHEPRHHAAVAKVPPEVVTADARRVVERRRQVILIQVYLRLVHRLRRVLSVVERPVEYVDIVQVFVGSQEVGDHVIVVGHVAQPDRREHRQALVRHEEREEDENQDDCHGANVPPVHVQRHMACPTEFTHLNQFMLKNTRNSS